MATSRTFFQPDIAESEWRRFWSNVTISDHVYDGSPCLDWTGSEAHGYGRFYVPGHKRMVRAHRWAYDHLECDPIPPQLEPDHLCRRPICIAPLHQEPVTPRINTLRSLGPSAANARKEACPEGHKYDAIHKSGARKCRKCRARREREKRQRRTQERMQAVTGRYGGDWRTRFVSQSELAELAGIAFSTLRAYRRRDKGNVPEPAFTFDGISYWDRVAAERWAQSRIDRKL